MEEEKTIDLWSNDSKIYALIDAESQRGISSLKNREFDLGNGQKLSLTITNKSGSPIPPFHYPFRTADIDFKMHFISGTAGWFRVDNQEHGYLHLHLQSGAQPFDKIIPVPENCSISGLISNIFEEAKKIVPWKFPDFKISCGSDFLGTA